MRKRIKRTAEDYSKERRAIENHKNVHVMAKCTLSLSDTKWNSMMCNKIIVKNRGVATELISTQCNR